MKVLTRETPLFWYLRSVFFSLRISRTLLQGDYSMATRIPMSKQSKVSLVLSSCPPPPLNFSMLLKYKFSMALLALAPAPLIDARRETTGSTLRFMPDPLNQTWSTPLSDCVIILYTQSISNITKRKNLETTTCGLVRSKSVQSCLSSSTNWIIRYLGCFR